MLLQLLLCSRALLMLDKAHPHFLLLARTLLPRRAQRRDGLPCLDAVGVHLVQGAQALRRGNADDFVRKATEKDAGGPFGITQDKSMLEAHDDQEALLVYDKLDPRHSAILALHGLLGLLKRIRAPWFEQRLIRSNAGRG